MKTENTNLQTKALLTMKEFAESISVSLRQLYRLIDRGELPEPVPQGKGGKRYFFREDLDTYLDNLRQQRK